MSENQTRPRCTCGQLALPIEDADWVINGKPFCGGVCYEQTVSEMLRAEEDGTLAEDLQASLEFHC